MTVPVVFIGGSGRSGSTLIGRILGQIPGFVDAGELSALAWAGLGENRLCGCGRSFDACPFWTSVGATAYGGWAGTDPDELQQATGVSELDGLRAILNGRSERDGVRHRHLAQLYQAISREAGGATVIDSSKAPRRAALLATMPVAATATRAEVIQIEPQRSQRTRRGIQREESISFLRISPCHLCSLWFNLPFNRVRAARRTHSCALHEHRRAHRPADHPRV